MKTVIKVIEDAIEKKRNMLRERKRDIVALKKVNDYLSSFQDQDKDFIRDRDLIIESTKEKVKIYEQEIAEMEEFLKKLREE